VRYVLLVIGLGVALFVLRTAILAFRSPIRHPWWWTFVCLLCGPVTTLNVDTGTMSTDLLSIVVLGVGYFETSPSGPTIIEVGFPLGTLLFLNRRRKLVSQARPMLAEDQLPN
jgi:hypothetical protein